MMLFMQLRAVLAGWALLPCHLLTFMLGPLGLLLYLQLRGTMRKQWEIGA